MNWQWKVNCHLYQADLDKLLVNRTPSSPHPQPPMRHPGQWCSDGDSGQPVAQSIVPIFTSAWSFL